MYINWARLQWCGGWKAPVGCLCQYEGVALWNHAAFRRNNLFLQHQHKRLGCQVSVESKSEILWLVKLNIYIDDNSEVEGDDSSIQYAYEEMQSGRHISHAKVNVFTPRQLKSVFQQEHVIFDDDHSEQSKLLNVQFITWSISVECFSYLSSLSLSIIPNCMRHKERRRRASDTFPKWK